MFACFGVRKAGVVVACDEDLVRVRLAVQPVKDSIELTRGPGLGEVARVYENVAVWQVRLGVVGVGDAHDAYPVRIWWRGEDGVCGEAWLEEEISPCCKSEKRRMPEAIPGRRGASMEDAV